MGFEEELIEASYKGAFFYVTSITQTSGRKDSKKEYPGADVQAIQDLGLDEGSFSVTGSVSARFDANGQEITSYRTARDDLRTALRSGGTGIFAHPFEGDIANVACRNYTLRESTSNVGVADLTINFEISNSDARPTEAPTTAAEIAAGQAALVAASAANLSEQFEVTNSFAGNFSDALDKVSNIGDSIQNAASPILLAADKINEFATEISNFGAMVASLVAAPQSLASAVSNLFQTLEGSISTVSGTLTAFQSLFDFGDFDISFSLDTAGRIERDRNRRAVNSAVQTHALAYAYSAAARSEFQTAEDVDEVVDSLEAQYAKVITSGNLDEDSTDALNSLRITALQFLQDQSVSNPRIITVESKLTSARLLSYSYYGDSSLGETIALLNDLEDSSFLEGSVRILSQ